MLNFLKFLLRSSKGSSARSSADLVDAVPLNSSTQITAKNLISLQQLARKLNLGRQNYARASSTGSHRSRFRGRGMDYQESRIYQAGDDIRNMDWRVTARSGKPHTKLYQEERERPVVLLVDFSPSMFFGSVNALKSVIASKVATILAWSVASKGDRIGALIINENHKGKGHIELPPKMGKRGVLQLIKALVEYSNPIKGLQASVKPNSLNEELKRLRHIVRPGSLIFLISDFYDINEETDQHLQRLSRHSDIQTIQIIDPLEISPPPSGRYVVTSGDFGENMGVLNTGSKKVKSTYEKFCSDHFEDLSKMMLRHNIPLMRISTADDVLLELQKHFSQTKRSIVVPSSELGKVA